MSSMIGGDREQLRYLGKLPLRRRQLLSRVALIGRDPVLNDRPQRLQPAYLKGAQG